MQTEEAKMIRVTQLEAAIRQLITAIRIFFAETDDFSVYSLTHNSLEILSKLLKQKSTKTMWEKIIEEEIKPEYQDVFKKDAVDPRNFFKHGMTRKGGVSEERDFIEFYPETNKLFLLFAVDAVRVHFQKEFCRHAELFLFLEWFRLHHPNIVNEDIRKQLSSLEEDRILSKSQFFQKNFPIAQSTLGSFQR